MPADTPTPEPATIDADTPPVHVAWARVMADVQGIAKRDRNQAQNFNFRGIDAVMNAVGPALRDHGVVVIPTDVVTNSRDIATSKGKPMHEVTVQVEYTIIGPAGDTMVGMAPGESADSGDKATPKAMSVAYRTFLLQALTIPTDEPDADATSVERDNPRAQQPPLDQRDQLAKSIAGFADWQKQVLAQQRDLHGWPPQLAQYNQQQLNQLAHLVREVQASTEPFDIAPAEVTAPHSADQPPEGSSTAQHAPDGTQGESGGPDRNAIVADLHSRYTADELREVLAQVELSTEGSKRDLSARLGEHYYAEELAATQGDA